MTDMTGRKINNAEAARLIAKSTHSEWAAVALYRYFVDADLKAAERAIGKVWSPDWREQTTTQTSEMKG